MKNGDTLKERYRIGRLLGRGGMGSTYFATDLETGRPAAAKILHLGRMEDWKSLELFEREARVLKGLDHPCIPGYIDFFNIGDGASLEYVLIQEYVEGVNLQDKVRGGWHATQDEVSAIARKLLRIIAYIHGLRPPIVHRDINPKNIILREDGEIFLVDFGGVQDSIRVEMKLDSTVVGTPGYTPLEQFVGRASPRSDLYGAAATILFLLTHRNPSELPTREMKIDMSCCPGLAEDVRWVLENWLEPDEEKRTLGLEEALAILEGRRRREGTGFPVEPAARGEPMSRGGTASPAQPDAQETEKPYGTRVEIVRENDRLAILIPERGNPAVIPVGCFSTFWLGFVAFWTFLSISSGAPIFFVFFSLPFWAVGLALFYYVLYSIFGRVEIELSPERGFSFTRTLFFYRRGNEAPLGAVDGCEIRPSSLQQRGGEQRTRCQIDIGVKTLKFGTLLSEKEKTWLRDAINDFLKTFRGVASYPDPPGSRLMSKG